MPIINEKRLLKENDHEAMKTLVTPPQENRFRIKKKKIKREEPPPIDPIFYQKISLALHEGAPVRSVLTIAAQKLGIAILIDKDIKTTIHYVAQDKPFIQIIDELTQALNLRFHTQGKFLKIEQDTPYPKIYSVHFLKFERESANSMSTSTNIFENNDIGAKNKESNKNGSDSEIKVKSSINFWDELENGLKFYLGKAPFTIHKQGGLISIIATEKQHRFVKEYLTQLQKVSNTQVLIEAKVIEVKLKQEFKTGIDWSYINGDNAIGSGNKKFKIAGDDFQLMDYKGSNFSFILNALEKFGSLRTVSSPRIVLLNNQTSMIKVAQNSIFFKIDYQTQYLGLLQQPKEGETNERYKILSSSDIKSRPVGFIMPIQACIQKDTNKILLFVRPTVSREAGKINDPAIDFNAKAARIDKDALPKSEIPIIEVREMDSVLQLESGDIRILGGLMEIKSEDTSSGLLKPGALDVAKTAFGKQELKENVFELVILIKATILDNDNDEMDLADQRLQKDFVKDARPFA